MAEAIGAHIKATTKKHAEIMENCYEGDRRGIVPAEAERIDPSNLFVVSVVATIFIILTLARYITISIFLWILMSAVSLFFIFFALVYVNARPIYIHFFPHVLIITDRNGYILTHHNTLQIQWNILPTSSPVDLLLKIRYIADTNDDWNIRYWIEKSIAYNDLYYYLTGGTLRNFNSNQ